MKLMKCLLLSIVIFSLMTVGGVSFASSVSVQPYPQVTQILQSPLVTINLDTTTQIRGYSISIAYDTTKLDFNQATRGSLFTGLNIGWWRVNTDTLGVVHVECLIFGTGLSVTGPGNMLNLRFNALAEDYSALTITSLDLYDVVGYVVPGVERNNGAVIIGNQPGYFNARCFLQGPYTEGSMSTQLHPVIPLTSPYTTGIVSTGSIPLDVVDWVLVELRTSPTGNTVASQAAFLYLDGSIQSVDKPFLLFMSINPGLYYVVVRHRNHLAIMSANPFNLAASGTPGFIDFCEIGNVYERAGIVEFEGDICAMLAGDADQDGGVYPSDRNNHWRVQNGQSGYKSADFNLNRIVTNSDLILYWRSNAGASSAVP